MGVAMGGKGARSGGAGEGQNNAPAIKVAPEPQEL